MTCSAECVLSKWKEKKKRTRNKVAYVVVIYLFKVFLVPSIIDRWKYKCLFSPFANRFVRLCLCLCKCMKALVYFMVKPNTCLYTDLQIYGEARVLCETVLVFLSMVCDSCTISWQPGGKVTHKILGISLQSLKTFFEFNWKYLRLAWLGLVGRLFSIANKQNAAKWTNKRPNERATDSASQPVKKQLPNHAFRRRSRCEKIWIRTKR